MRASPDKDARRRKSFPRLRVERHGRRVPRHPRSAGFQRMQTALELVPEGEEMLRRRVRLRRAVALQEREHAEIDVGIGDQSKSSGEMSPPIS